jgi:dTDP-4-dehydrorhamnose 3,5-epimerase
MRVISTTLPEVVLIEPTVVGDPRGYFLESFHEERYRGAGISGPFVQDNLSYSQRAVLRGLHLQHPYGQGKLISVLEGQVFDVAVDVRVGSPRFGQWTGTTLSSEDRRQLWVPAGFAHGFVVLSAAALVSYKCTDYYHPETELSIRWDDPAIGISWPTTDVTLSARDSVALPLGEVAPGRLPGVDA